MRFYAVVAVAGLVATAALTVQVGELNYVLYPSPQYPHVPDQSTLVINTTNADGSSELRGYTAFGETLEFIAGPSLSAITWPPRSVATWDLEAAVVPAGNASAAFGAVHREHGWYYHGSYRYNGYITLATLNVTDMIWACPTGDDVNASIIILSAGEPNIGGPNNTGTGPHWAVAVGAYLYIYAQDAFAINATTGEPVLAYTVARSLIADGGVPGSWWKYYQGAWTQPGLGGQATALDNLVGAKMVWLEAQSVWLAISYTGTLSISPDGLSWSALPSTLLPAVPPTQPLAGYTNVNRYYYTSLIPGWGGSTLYAGDTLWLYCLFDVATNDSWANVTRGLAATPLTIVPANASQPGTPPTAVVSLASYVRGGAIEGETGGAGGAGVASRGVAVDTWATVSPVDLRTWSYEWFLGYLLASPDDAPNATVVPLVDCFDVARDDHYVALPGECVGGDGSTAANRLLGMLGYVGADNVSLPGYQSMPLYRCFNAAANDSYVNPLDGCRPGDQNQTLLGYMWWQND